MDWGIVTETEETAKAGVNVNLCEPSKKKNIQKLYLGSFFYSS